MSIGRIIKPRVFLEGVEIPAYRVTVQAAIGGPAVAAIDIPPSEKFFERYDEDPPGSGKYVKRTGVIARSLVHVFYEDSGDPEKLARLLFEGELVRFEYSKETSSRILRIIARDTSNLLSSTYVRYYNDFFTPYGKLTSAFAGVGTPDKQAADNVRMNIIKATNVNPEIQEAIVTDKAGAGIGAAFRSIVDSAFKTNSFYANFDARTKLSRKVLSLVDRKSRLLLQGSLLESMVHQNMSNLKESATVWDLFSTLMSLVFYYPVPVLAPPYLDKEIVEEPSGSSDTLKSSYRVTPGKTTMNLLLKPYTWWTAPPTFNVIFPCQYKSFSLTRDFLSEPTRIIISAFGVLESLAQQELTQAAPSQYLFIAPQALAKKFSQEAYDTSLPEGSATIYRTSKELEDLRAQLRDAEIKTYDSALSIKEKAAAAARVTDLQGQVSAKEKELQELVKKAESRPVIKPDDQDQTGAKPSNMDAQYWNRSVLSGSDDVSLASREDHKGIVFGFDYLTQTQTEVTKAKSVSPTAMKRYLSNVANYKLAIQQHKARSTSVTLHFAPHLVAGFPALLVDPNRNFFGEVEAVTHSFDANGAADTVIQMSFVRGDDMEFAEASRSNARSIQFPEWISEKYLPSNVGDSVYGPLFPKNGRLAASSSIMAFGATQQEAAREIRRRYYRTKDDIQFAQSFTRRNVASIDQAFSVLGAQKVNPGHYVLDISSSERRVAVLEYANEVSRAHFAVVDSVRDAVDRVANPSPVPASTAAPKGASQRVEEVTVDQDKELEIRSAAKSLKLEVVNRFRPPAPIPPSGAVSISRDAAGTTLSSAYEDSENSLLDGVTLTSESGDEIKYVATSEYHAKLPGGGTALLARGTFSGSVSSVGGTVTRDEAFLAGLVNAHAATLAKLKATR